MFRHTAWVCTSIALSTIMLLGCSTDSGSPPQAKTGQDDQGSAHAHPSKGPHGESLIELGNDDFHAELVRDGEAGQIEIYLLDATVSVAVPIEAAEVTVNLRRDGEAHQFQVAARATAEDPPGRSSCFASTQKELADELNHDHLHGQLVVTIDGKQYRGDIGHSHDDEPHTHGKASNDQNAPSRL
jgi:hypothetical protein